MAEEEKKEENEEVRICNLLGGEADGGFCRIPLKYYKSETNCKELFGEVSDEGSCDINIKYLIRLKKDNKYTD